MDAKSLHIAVSVAITMIGAVYVVWQGSQLAAFTVAYGEFVSGNSVPSAVITPEADTPVLFVGDIMLGRNVELLSNINGVAYPFASIAGLLAAHEIVVANFESAAALQHVRTKSGGFQFSTTKELISALGQHGVTHASLANNHGLDYGAAGYQNAVDLLGQAGIAVFGHPTIVASSSVTYITQNGVRIALVGVHTLFSEPDVETMQNIFAEASSFSDVQIAYVHWGNEYELVHSSSQENFARLLITAGADVIIGHHPHVTQDIQVYEGVPVFYSLGNFIFDQYFSKDVQEGYALTFSTSVEQFEFSLIPVSSALSRSQPYVLDGGLRDAFLQALAERSDPRFVANIEKGSLILSRNLASSSQTSMIAR